MDTVILEKSYPLSPIDEKEVYRYSGVGEVTPEMEALLRECISLCEGKFKNNLCYGVYEIKSDGESVDFGFSKVKSQTLVKNLKDCNRVIIFCATVGIEIDRLVARYGTISPAKAVMLQAIGAERIESLCNTFNEDIKREYNTVPRISPGYGDFPLEFQREIFKLLSPSKRMGLTLNESLLMSPTKSVTAVVGVKRK